MLFSMPRRNGGGWNGFKENRLCNSSIAASELLIHDVPKRSDSPSLFIKEIFEEAWLVEYSRVRIAFAIVAEFGEPIIWFLRIDHREKISRIKKRPAGIIQNAQIICFNADDNIRLPERQVLVTVILFLQFDDHHSRVDS